MFQVFSRDPGPAPAPIKELKAGGKGSGPRRGQRNRLGTGKRPAGYWDRRQGGMVTGKDKAQLSKSAIAGWEKYKASPGYALMPGTRGVGSASQGRGGGSLRRIPQTPSASKGRGGGSLRPMTNERLNQLYKSGADTKTRMAAIKENMKWQKEQLRQGSTQVLGRGAAVRSVFPERRSGPGGYMGGRREGDYPERRKTVRAPDRRRRDIGSPTGYERRGGGGNTPPPPPAAGARPKPAATRPGYKIAKRWNVEPPPPRPSKRAQVIRRNRMIRKTASRGKTPVPTHHKVKNVPGIQWRRLQYSKPPGKEE